MRIRRATVDDAQAIATVHVASWRAAYRGLMPQNLLDELSVEQRTVARRQRLQDQAIETFVVVEEDPSAVENVVGFAAVGPSRDPDEKAIGELYALYLDPQVWSTGTGGRLHDHALEALERRYALVTLWVLDGNTRAESFYLRRRWSPDGTTKRMTTDGIDVAEHRLRRERAPR